MFDTHDKRGTAINANDIDCPSVFTCFECDVEFCARPNCAVHEPRSAHPDHALADRSHNDCDHITNSAVEPGTYFSEEHGYHYHAVAPVHGQ